MVNNIKDSATVLVAISLVFFVFAGVCLGAGGDMGGADPNGSEAHPYLIEDLVDFDVFATDPNYWASGVHTKLACDPNLSGRTYTTAVIAPDMDNSSSGFQGPVFLGTFDGNGHVIRNLAIDTAGAGNSYLGLFGKMEGANAEVKNLGIVNYNITGSDVSHSFGGLCGWNSSGQITNSYSEGSVSGNDELGGLCGYNSGTITSCYASGSLVGDDYLGGLCGLNRYGIITDCNATGAVTGDEYLGGLCGRNWEGTITDSYSTGPVNGYYHLGGLCGMNYSGTIIGCYATGSVDGVFRLGGLCGMNFNGIITNCYATGSVAGDDNLGGLCGYNDRSTISNCYSKGSVTGGVGSYRLGGLCGGNYHDTIINCYATGAVTTGGDSDNLSGLCGTNNEGRIINCFWDIETSGISDPEGGLAGTDTDGMIGITIAEMQTKSNFVNAGWDFTGETANGTHQAWQMPAGGGRPLLSWFIEGYVPVVLSGDGSEGNPYLIRDVNELGAVLYYDTNAYYELESDIDLSGIQWSSVITPVFGGSFDGNGHVISNMNIQSGGHLGLFGTISGENTEVKNLGIVNCNITGGDNSSYLGGLCGENRYGTIFNCYSKGSVTGGSYLGGLCGWNTNGTITNCYTKASVSGGSEVGGLCGYNEDGVIGNCYATDSISGENNVGGLCGRNWSGTITNSCATGSITGNKHLGGLCGDNWGGTFANCYSTGSVTGEANSENLGGLCGYNSNGEITNSYATGLITGGVGSLNLGGLCGKNYSGTISNCFWDTDTSGMGVGYNLDLMWPGTITNVVGEATAEMQDPNTFSDGPASWDFSDGDGDEADWMMLREGEDYPRLAWQEIFDADIAGLYGVDMVDFTVFSGQWLEEVCDGGNDNCQGADFDGVNGVGVEDLLILVDNWLAGL